MGGYLCYLASAIRQAEFANAAKDFGIKGKKREPISSLMILTGFFNMRKGERFAQRPNKPFIVADRFARAVRNFRHRFTVTIYQLKYNTQRIYLADIHGSAGCNTKP